MATWRAGVRNTVALLASVAGAFALFGALASAGGAGSRLAPTHLAFLVVQTALLGLAGATVLWFGVRIAASPHVLYPPFLLLAIASFRWLAFPWQRWPIGLGMLVTGLVVGVAGHLSLRSRAARPD